MNATRLPSSFRFAGLLSLVLALLLCAGCSAQPKKTGSVAAPSDKKAGSQAATGASGDAPKKEGNTTSSSSGVQAAQKNANNGPEPLKLDWEPDATIEANISSKCVVRGGAMTLTVKTKPKSSVGFIAMYADNQGGGPPPYGKGYGGNDGSMIDETGQKTWVWTVRADTPIGPARVDVIASVIGEGKAHSELPFAVKTSC